MFQKQLSPQQTLQNQTPEALHPTLLWYRLRLLGRGLLELFLDPTLPIHETLKPATQIQKPRPWTLHPKPEILTPYLKPRDSNILYIIKEYSLIHISDPSII